MQPNRDNRTSPFKFIKMKTRFFPLNPLHKRFRLFAIPFSLVLGYFSYRKYKQTEKENRRKQPLTLAEPNLVSDVQVSL